MATKRNGNQPDARPSRPSRARGMGVTLTTNRNNQPSFVVPVGAFHAADVPPFVGGFTRPCDRTGARASADAARFARVGFGARVGRMIAATPARDRNAVIVACVAVERTLAHHIAGTGRVGFVAYDVATGPDGRDARAVAGSVASARRRLRNAGTRAAIARRMIADARETRTADVPDAVPASADDTGA